MSNTGEWMPIETAPKTGIEIEISYGDGNDAENTCFAMWSDRPVCMGGPTVYNKPGWVTGPSGECDTNLPLDPPKLWRHI